MWNEFLTWLKLTPHGHDIICIQETFWRDDHEWDDDEWTYIHHGSHKPKEAGLLMCISKKLAPSHMIKHTPVLVGRLQHVRIFFPQPLDILHVYQHAWYHQKQDDPTDWWQGAISRRHRFLQKLQSTLRGLPIRNPLCVIGDLNTSLPHMPGVTGMGRPSKPGPQSDVDDLCSLLEVHRLCACNTFGKAPAATFINDATGAATQIDFVLIRQLHSDRDSKKATPFRWPVASTRKGAQHVPVKATFTLKWTPWSWSQPAEQNTSIPPRQVADSLRQNPKRAEEFTLALAKALPHQPTIKQLDQSLMTTWHAVDGRPATDLPGIADRPHQQVLKLWEARANLHLAPRTDSLLMDCFHHWRALAPVLKAELQLKRAARQRKRDFLNDCLKQAEEASATGNHALTYRIVRVLAPKQPKKRIQIRTPQGQVQRPSAERDTLVSYFRDLYQSPIAPPATASCPALYTQDGCLMALQALPRQKAVLPGAAPGILWSIGASVLAPAVTDTLNNAFAALPEPPQPEITDISLCLLPKPAKVAQQPADVRPISLLHPVNKIQAGMLARIVKPYLTSYLHDIPQYAYVSERSAPEALCRVFSHLHKVRQNAPTKEGMVQRRQQGVLRTECQGGITFSLDVAKAFDTIPRWVIIRACEDAQIPSEVIQHITAVHEQLNVGLCHFGHKGSCRTSRGIRQGCNLAPSLWSLATAYVHKHLRSTLGPEIDSIVTWFADDVIAQWQVQTIQELRGALSQLSTLVTALRQFGMDVSSQKSVILYSLHGTKAAQFLHSSRIKRADKWHLRISPDLDFPIVRQHKYLGVIISYGSFETHTLDHRMKCASATFARLRHILCTKNVLSTAKRVLLWRTIVWPTLKYGLSSLLLSYKDHARLTGYVARQLRTITGQLAHLTHEPTHDFLQKWNARPGTSLHAEVVTNQQRYHRQTGLCAARVTQWFHLLLATYHTAESLPSASRLTPVEAIVTQVHQCPDCPSCFATAGLLKIHRVKAHKHEKVIAQRKQAQMKNQVEHSLQGVPTCRHCKHEFNGWRNFNTHILLGNCPVLGLRSTGSPVPNASPTEGAAHCTVPAPQTLAEPDTAFAPTISLEATYQELQVTRGDQWRMVTQSQTLRSRMKNHCPECNLYAADSSRIKVHMKAKHHDSLDLLEHAEALSSCVRTGKPCLYCGQHIPKTTFEGTHAVGCFVLWQTMYVMLQSGVIPSGLDYDSKRFRNSRWGRARLVSEVHAEPTDRRGGRDGAGKGGQAAEDPDRAEGRQWKTREGQGQPPRANGPHSIQAFLRQVPRHERPESAPVVSAADQNGPPPGGCSADHSPRHLIRRVAQDGLTSRGTGGDVHGGPEVEGAEGTRGSQSTTATCALDVSSDRAGGQDKSSQVDGGTEGTFGEDGLPQGRSLAVPEIVIRRGATGSGHRSLPTLHARCPSASEGSAVTVSGSLGHHAVPSHTAPRPGAEGPQHHVPDVGCAAVGASQRTSLDPPEAGRKCLHTDRGHVASSGKAQPLQPREAALEVPADGCAAVRSSWGVTDHAHAGGTPAPAIPASMGGPSTHIDQQLVLRAKLLNRGNTCYTNAVVHALLWLACRTCSPTMPSGLMKAFQAAIKDRKGLHVWQLLAWRQLMKDWAQPNRQHDAAELFTFFQDRGFADMFEGNWQRRTLTNGHMCVEEAGSTMPLLLPTPLFAHCTPQHLLDTWHAQAGFAGLLTAPTHLIVQINRFATAEETISKSTCPVDIISTLNVPVFTVDLATTMTLYRLHACILHLGPTPTSGHYRSVLYTDDRRYITDDNMVAKSLLQKDAEQLSLNVYILLYSRVHSA